MSLITNIEELRAVIGEEIPGLGEKNIDELDSFAIEFIEKSPFLILTTSDNEGRCDASPKGDSPGFVWVLDKKTIVIPDRPGNKLAYGHLNILENPHVGIIFMIPGTSETLRINGKAELDSSPELLNDLSARGKPAVLAIRVDIEECFFHCAKAFIRSGLWDSGRWPDEPHKVSFGEMYASRKKASDEVASAIDKNIKADYENNL